MEFNLADLFENAADHFGDREYLVAEGARRTYAEMEARANQLAHHLASQGIGPGDHVGIYALNCVEWVETLWAVFKLRAVWININYRYVEDELRYIFGNAHLRALVVQPEFAERAESCRDAMPDCRHVLVMGDEYEAALAAQSPERDFGPRSPDDRYILYTGGTTGMPKGVVWRHHDVFFSLGGGVDPLTNELVEKPEDMAAKGVAQNFQITFLPTAPLMHGASQWAVMGQSFTGNKIVLVAKFDADRVWELVEQEKVNAIMITGDAMGRPLIEALEQSAVERDLSSLFSVTSTAAIFSPSVKDQFLARFPNLVMTDAVGSSETGSNGLLKVESGHTGMKGGPTVSPFQGTVVLDEVLRVVRPGSGVVGKLARTGFIPLEYYGDPLKTAETFVTGADGRRYAMPGDSAMVEDDGTITLLGRGSQSINSGGEKIFPEEVEAAVKSHPDVYDALVVGVPDEKWGQRVAAVIQPRPGANPALEDVQDHCRKHIAGYKVPRELHVVDEIQRSPSGKADYPWAKKIATSS